MVGISVPSVSHLRESTVGKERQGELWADKVLTTKLRNTKEGAHLGQTDQVDEGSCNHTVQPSFCATPPCVRLYLAVRLGTNIQFLLHIPHAACTSVQGLGMETSCITSLCNGVGPQPGCRLLQL